MEPTPLALRIGREIGGGRIPFARFMERALYDPRDGYYMKGVPPEMRERDYYTSPDVGEVFGRCLARQFAEMWRALDEPAPFRIVELGAGRGLLCRDVLRALEEESPACHARTEYVAVERSPKRLETLRVALGDGPAGEAASARPRVTWADSLLGVPPGVTGVVFSNELFDALPVHRVCPTEAGLQEVYVRAEGGRFSEELGAPSTPALAAYFEALGLGLAAGDERGRAEVNLLAVELMEEIARRLERGFVVTLDYGHPAPELYAPGRVAGGGTLMCYHRHRAHTDPYVRVGEQDLTAHVDFTALALAGRRAGLEPLGFTDQLHFLMGLGIAEGGPPPGAHPAGAHPAGAPGDETLRRNLAIKRLLLPGGLGGTLKVLIQGKGVAGGKAGALSGLRSAVFRVSGLLP